MTEEGDRAGTVLGTGAWLGLLVVVLVLLWITAPTAAERLFFAFVGVVLAIGVIGQHGAPSRGSRLPPVVQGIAVGAVVGATAAVVALGGLETWGPLGVLFALPPLFPRVVPARWRHLATARWSDLARVGTPQR